MAESQYPQNIPTDLANKLKAARKQRAMQGERRIVTILFCDVTGSTSMAEQLDPEDWAVIMDEAFDYLIAPIYRYEGTVARLMGDAILAFFGAPIAHEDDPQRALLAALDILADIQPFRQRVKREYDLDFNVRLGINTGMVVVGEIGSDLQVEYTAMGDAVNLAARMEQTAAPGTIQITAETHRRIAPLFDVEEVGEIEVKGKGQAVQTYRVIAKKADPGSLRGIRGLSAPLIGRAEEYTKLERALDELLQGRGGIVTIIGEAGLGKSRLMEEMRARCAADGEGKFNIIELSGISYDSQSPYGMFRRALKNYFGIADDDPPEVGRDKIEGNEQYSSLHMGENVERMLNAMSAVLGLPQAADEQPLEGEAFKRELFESNLEVWRDMASETPTLTLVDDLHWADPASIELLQHLLQLADTEAILFLCAMRPHRQSPGWQLKLHADTQYPHRYTEINLTPLDERDSHDLVNSLLDIAKLPPELLQLIERKTDGNPFFLEEVVRSLIDSGAVAHSADGLHWQATAKVSDIDIPDNLHSMLAARIDRLEQETRHTLQLASVIGRSFYHRVLNAIYDLTSSLDLQLNTLQRVEMILEAARQPELEYLFRHELTRDAAYRSILRRNRKLFHLQVAQAMEALFPNRLDEEASRLAYHFERAEDYEKALHYYTLAGDQAASMYANTEAISHYSKAIEAAKKLEVSGERLTHLYTSRGRVWEVSSNFDAALENYKELDRAAREAGDKTMRLAALIPQVIIYATPTSKFDLQVGKEIALPALDLAEQLEDARSQVKVLWALMLQAVFSEESGEIAVQYGEKALPLARQHNLREELAYLLNDLGRPYMDLNRMDDALSALLEANQLWRELNNLPMLADNLGSISQIYGLRGDFEKAMRSAEEGLEISVKIDSRWGQAYILTAMSVLHLHKGHIDDALEALKSSLVAGEEANFLGAQFNQLLLGWVYLFFGDKERATAVIEPLESFPEEIGRFVILQYTWQILVADLRGQASIAIEKIRQLNVRATLEETDPYLGSLAVLIIGDTLLKSREFESLTDVFRTIIAKNESLGVRSFQPDLMRLLAICLVELGQTAQAHQLLHEAYELAKEIGATTALLSILVELGPLEERQGEPQRAADLRREAQEVIQYLADHCAKHPELRESFLDLPKLRAFTT